MEKRKSLILFLIFLFLAVNFSAQEVGKRFSITTNDEPMSSVFKKIGKASGVRVEFAYEDVNPYRVTVSLKDVTAAQAVKAVVADYPLTYSIKADGKFIIISRLHRVIQQPKRIQQKGHNTTVVHGKVVDASNSPLPGVNVTMKSNGFGMTTDGNGNYTLYLEKGAKETLIFSFIGMKTTSFTVNADSEEKLLNVTLKENANELGEVVVTGMFTHRAESFTGSATTYNKEQLTEVGNQNLLKSLKNLDPSFQIMESMDFGSDPNKTPDIQIRGQSSLPNLNGDYQGNPNQPLFILDGFETDITKMYDLDMNRVQSVTILKDAAAKAIYGSKAGNGVIVVETIRPKSGELKVHYSGSMDIEAPDLTGYNLMNASEKLAFEKKMGIYSNYVTSASEADMLDQRYQEYYENVQKGVDTYWLSKPLRTGLGQKHSVTIEGGDSRMRYQAGLSYNNIKGAMKGSDRNTLGISTTLSYSYKNLIFRNTLEYTKNWAANSPYGSFSDYAALNQYYVPYEENGSPKKILGYYGSASTPVYNPLYNASLNTKSTSNYAEVRDNFGLEWNINKDIKATARFSYTRTENGADVFYPGSHTMFAEYDANGLSDRKGRYTKTNGYYQSISADAGINFNHTFGKHLIFANATWNISDVHTVSDTYTAEGFGNDYMDNIGFATQYLKNGKPTASDSKTREIGLIGALNYSYADRYLFDASIRTTGSSMYGSDNRWGWFWALGAGWNVHHEKFMENNKWIKQLKIRSSIGYTGTQNSDPYQSRARYSYGDVTYNGRLGASLLGLPNNSLKWQRVMDFNVGFDLMLKRFLTARFDYYIKNTDDLLSAITIPPSMGFSSYTENLGQVENKGYDLAVTVTPWRSDKNRAWLSIGATAIHNTNKIKKIYDIFKSYNDSQNTSKTSVVTTNLTDSEWKELITSKANPSTLYYEGQSMTAIWGMQSLGIDPMTGKELFLDKDGNSTYTWSTANQVVIGDTSPKLQGSFTLGGGYKGFTLNLVCTYRLGGDLYNTTLVNKVENVSGYDNLDKRILDSWQNVGDIAPYRKLATYASSGEHNITYPTSRFVQKNNELYFSSLNLGYEFYNSKWMKTIGMQRLKFTFYMNELLRLSTVKVERGTSYPFARTFSFALQASF